VVLEAVVEQLVALAALQLEMEVGLLVVFLLVLVGEMMELQVAHLVEVEVEVRVLMVVEELVVMV
jgi:hypothetical protein